MTPDAQLVSVAGIESRIHLLRGQRVMLDADLARLYGVETKALNKAVGRNAGRFPPDFMFQLAADEMAALRFQIGSIQEIFRAIRQLMQAPISADKPSRREIGFHAAGPKPQKAGHQRKVGRILRQWTA